MMKSFWKLIIFCFLTLYWTGQSWSHPSLHNYVIILLDASGSMKQSDPHFLRRDATKLLITLLRPGDRVILGEFGDGIKTHTNGDITLSPETQSTLFRLVDNLSSKDRFTDILGACQYAVNVIASLPVEVRQSFAPSVILLTDGKDEMPGQGDRSALIESKLQELAKLGAKIHTVGFPGKSDMKILEKAANLTGGDLWLIHQPNDLLRGFFGLSRVMGNRWPLQEQAVSQGTIHINLPKWAHGLVVCYLPTLPTSERVRISVPVTQEIITPTYQILRIDKTHSQRLDISLPKSGTILVDAESTLLLQTEKGKKTPAQLPFPFNAYVSTVQGVDLGHPHFLSHTVITLKLHQYGLPEIILPLYDDGQHEDGKPGDGRFGGFVSGLREGRWHYQLTARTPYAPTLSVSGEIEALAIPVSISPPGRIVRFFLAPFTGSLSWKICNLTDFPLNGEFALSTKEGKKFTPLSWKGKECQKAELTILHDWHRGTAFQVSLRLSQQMEPVWKEQYYIRPWWIPGALFLGIFALVGLTFIFPRRSPQGSTLTVTATIDGETLVRILRVNRQGQVETSDLPHPLNDPGIFQACSGIWRRGIIYRPATWCQPTFLGERPPKKGHGYLVRGPITWRCASEQTEVEYRLSPRF